VYPAEEWKTKGSDRYFYVFTGMPLVLENGTRLGVFLPLPSKSPMTLAVLLLSKDLGMVDFQSLLSGT
jgi:hypothetical protein